MDQGEYINRRAIIAHVAPYVAWIALLQFLDIPQIPAAVGYAVRSVLCLGAFVYLKPWKWYSAPRLRNVPLAILVGLVVFAVWVGPETEWFKANLHDIAITYEKWCVRPFGEMRPDLPEAPPYAPGHCGWALALFRIGGSAFVIAVIEEFFFRGFLYRWTIDNLFTKVDAGRIDIRMFLIVALIFAFEHNEWLAGLFCGIAYGWLYVQTRDIWAAALAHVVTNLVLGIYIIKTGAYQFW